MSGDRHSKQRGQRWEALLQAREVCIRQLLVTRVMGARTGKPVSLLPPALVKKKQPQSVSTGLQRWRVASRTCVMVQDRKQWLGRG